MYRDMPESIVTPKEHKILRDRADAYLGAIPGFTESEGPDPNIADSDGLVTYLNASSNPPPEELVKEQIEISKILEGLTGIVTAAVLQVSGQDEAEKHNPDIWKEPMQYGLAPFIGGFATSTVTYNRRVRGVDIATSFLNILIDAVVGEGAALADFKKFLESQGETISIKGEDTQEGYKYAVVGIVHELFQEQTGRWIYVPKIKAYFTQFTRKTFKLSVACASYEDMEFDFLVEKFVAPFKIETWRQEEWFREEVDDFIKKWTQAQIGKSNNYFEGIFKSKPSTSILPLAKAS